MLISTDFLGFDSSRRTGCEVEVCLIGLVFSVFGVLSVSPEYLEVKVEVTQEMVG